MIYDMLETIDSYALTNPDTIVYDCMGDCHSYKELKIDSDSLAFFIDQLQLQAKSPVLVFGAQSYDMLVTFIALNKAGHAYIPVDVHSAPERIKSIIDIAKPAAVFAIEELPIEVSSVPVYAYQDIEKAKLAKSNYHMSHSVKGDDNYYIIFTSGTTGQPKGVQISHDNLLSFTNWMIESPEFKLPSFPQMLAQPPYSFDLSVMYWAPTLALGGTLFALPKEIVSDYKVLFKTIINLPIGIWTSTPSFVDMALLSEDFCHEKMPLLTHFYFDGEELTVSTAKKLFERFPDAHIVNAYGPTEATVALSAIAITKEMTENYKRLPIGYPKADSPTYILDEDLNILPPGQQGEIVVTGPAVSKGYINNPNKTAEAFFTFNGQKAYHTGDVGSYADNQLLIYGGRLDFQIKYAGYRIELEDVSQQLNQSPYVESAVAVPRYNDSHKVQNLLAIIVLKDGLTNEFKNEREITKAIKESVKDKMMSYMMPQKFIFKDVLPLTANGKIDIKSLINEVNQR
ncbi:D-alanine--poly(phosphoribitol) ligase subunit DltA [Streptococcus didelphis]|uniref:D-alanine--D-alanyl carrier protein ligase n=1 Tax=Streptococcus didelphis TaxID=102886 RepID=A0ABY9LH05_9STRE|nr:D-alanine--poly(phosphoribitol) ligase subunit DltA [Streptococcus didelphis]WMB28132.1 D-alanine--poly(phosphoribitol) ligase subunit DltA [Streptococcus didelphis]WMB30053.1 D-alanine--poly(phosphoribitol) ligase subunit DltA [Streptococcus didelphis]